MGNEAVAKIWRGSMFVICLPALLASVWMPTVTIALCLLSLGLACGLFAFLRNISLQGFVGDLSWRNFLGQLAFTAMAVTLFSCFHVFLMQQNWRENLHLVPMATLIFLHSVFMDKPKVSSARRHQG